MMTPMSPTTKPAAPARHALKVRAAIRAGVLVNNEIAEAPVPTTRLRSWNDATGHFDM